MAHGQRPIWVLGLLFILIAALPAGAVPNRIDGQFIFGTNLAWFDHNYGHDLGPSHKERWHPSFTEAQCDRYFAALASAGCPLLRVWAFEAQEGLVFDKSDKMVTGLDPLFLANVDKLMQIAAKHRIRLYWSLLNHLIATDEDGKHMNILRDDTVRKSYIEKAAVPFVKHVARHPTFWAVDVINEAEGAVGKINFLSGRGKFWEGCTWRTMRAFIKACASAFHTAVPGIKVTATSGWHEHKNLGRFKDLGLDFLDWHSYQDDGKLPHVNELDLGGLPCVLGECGPKKKERDDTLTAKNWQTYFSEAWNKGYAGVLSWSFGTPGEDTNFTMYNNDMSARAMVAPFTRFAQAHAAEIGPRHLTGADKAIVAAACGAAYVIMTETNKATFMQYVGNTSAIALRAGYPYRTPAIALARLDTLSRDLDLRGRTLLSLAAANPASLPAATAVQAQARKCLEAIANATRNHPDALRGNAAVTRLQALVALTPAAAKKSIQQAGQTPVGVGAQHGTITVQTGAGNNPFGN